jgi:hypothetical protein
MADIFISYAREDRETAKTLAQALAVQGWSLRSLCFGISMD